MFRGFRGFPWYCERSLLCQIVQLDNHTESSQHKRFALRYGYYLKWKTSRLEKY